MGRKNEKYKKGFIKQRSVKKEKSTFEKLTSLLHNKPD